MNSAKLGLGRKVYDSLECLFIINVVRLKASLCNGTRLLATELRNHLVEAQELQRSVILLLIPRFELSAGVSLSLRSFKVLSSTLMPIRHLYTQRHQSE